MNEYKQGIDLQFMSNIDEIQQQLNEMKTNIRLNFDSSGKSVNDDGGLLPKEMSKFQKAVAVFKQSTNSINEFFGVQLPTSFEDVFKSALSGLGSLLKSAWSELDTMFSYNYLSDSDVRNLRLTWGLDAGEAYTYSTVADMMGIESLEDFAFMSDAELATFEKASNKIYEVWSEYGTDTELSDALMDFKVEMQVLKIEMLKPLMNVLTEERTKEAIKKFIDYLPDFLEALITIAEGLTNWLTSNGWYSAKEKTVDYIETYDEELKKSTEERDWEALVEKYNATNNPRNLPGADISVEDYKKMVERDEALQNWSISTANNIEIFIDGVKQKLTQTSSSNDKQTYSARTTNYAGGSR